MISDKCCEAIWRELCALDKKGHCVAQGILRLLYLNRLLSCDEKLELELKLGTLTSSIISLFTHFIHCTFSFSTPKIKYYIFFFFWASTEVERKNRNNCPPTNSDHLFQTLNATHSPTFFSLKRIRKGRGKRERERDKEKSFLWSWLYPTNLLLRE